MPSPAPRPLAVALLTVGAVAALGVLAWRHPGLRMVDVIGFSTRAENLGDHLVDPLYPVGYPALLALFHGLGFDILPVAKALSVAASAVAAIAASFLTNPAAAAWMLVQPGTLQWGATEGTDMPAAALALGAMSAACRRRSGLAGLLLGAACLVRYTALAAVPVVLVLDRRAWRTFALAVAPHFVLAAWSGASPFPDQSLNLGIGAGRPTRLLSIDTILRWPIGFGRALLSCAPDWPTRLTALGLFVGWRDRAARALLAFVLLHAALIGVAFSNARLCLPAQLALSLGVAWIVPPAVLRRLGGRLGPRASLLVPALGACVAAAFYLPIQWRLDGRESERATIAAACATLDGSVISNSPWFYTHRHGWLVGSTQLTALGQPRDLTPAGLADRLRRTDSVAIALEMVRLPNAMPGLVPMMKATPPGFVKLAGTPGWSVWTLE